MEQDLQKIFIKRKENAEQVSILGKNKLTTLSEFLIYILIFSFVFNGPWVYTQKPQETQWVKQAATQEAQTTSFDLLWQKIDKLVPSNAPWRDRQFYIQALTLKLKELQDKGEITQAESQQILKYAQIGNNFIKSETQFNPNNLNPSYTGNPDGLPPKVNVMPTYYTWPGQEITVWGNAKNISPYYQPQNIPYQFDEDIGNLTSVIGFWRLGYVEVQLPFSFTLYDKTTNKMFINQAGIVDFDESNTERAYWYDWKISFPISTNFRYSIAPFSSYVFAGGGYWGYPGWVYYNPVPKGDLGHRYVSITWVDMAFYYTPWQWESITFQLLIYEDGRFQFNYKKIVDYSKVDPSWRPPTIGVNKGDGLGYIVIPYPSSGTSILFNFNGTTFTWDFGDGLPQATGPVYNSKYIPVKHTYQNKGFYTITLTVENSSYKDTDTSLVIVSDDTLETRVNKSIQDGLRWLYLSQDPDGSWKHGVGPQGSLYAFGEEAATAFALLAFENNGHLPTNDPNKDIYAETVQKGLDYIFSKAVVHPIQQQPAGNPDTNGNGVGIAFYISPPSTWPANLYVTPMAMLPIIASNAKDRIITTGPEGVKGRTYYDALVDVIDFIAWAQNETQYSALDRGGWRYEPNYWWGSDNSVTAWPTMALQAAESIWGIKAADFVKKELSMWLGVSQQHDGGFSYYYWGPAQNVALTAGAIVGLIYTGVNPYDARVRKAFDFIDLHWKDWFGEGAISNHFGNFYAMYSVSKATRVIQPEIKLIGNHDWYKEYSQWLIQNQYPDGRWEDTSWVRYYAYRSLITAWGILILTPTLIGARPVADAGPDQKVLPDTAVKLDGSLSHHVDPRRKIVHYKWDFDHRDGVDFNFPDATGQIVTNEKGYPFKNSDYNVIVTLQVTDDIGQTDTDTAVITVTTHNVPPVAVIDVPPLAFTGQYIFLDGSKSYDPNTGPPLFDKIVSYEWDLNGDGVFGDATGTLVPIKFDSPTTQKIGLKVTDSFGLSNTFSTYITINVIEPPVVAVTTTLGYFKNHPDLIQANLPVTLGTQTISTLQQALDLLNAPTKGDQTLQLKKQLLVTKLNVKVYNIGDLVVQTVGKTINQIIAEADQLLITGGTKQQISAMQELLDLINNAGLDPTKPGAVPTTDPPVVTVTLTPSIILVGETTAIKVDVKTVTEAVGVVYINLFVNGTPIPVTREGVATYVPASSGQFTVSATALDYAGKTGSGSATLTVQPDATSPAITLEVAPAVVIVDNPVTITFSATDNVKVITRELYINSTNLTHLINSINSTNSINSINYIPRETGTFTVTFKASDLAGNTATAQKTLTVIPHDTTPPTVTISISPAKIFLGDTVTFTVTATDNRKVVGKNLMVNGTVLPLTNDSATFKPDRSGIFTASAYADDAEGNRGTASTTFKVLLPDETPPTVSVVISPTLVNTGEIVKITIVASDNVGIVSQALTINGMPVPISVEGVAIISPTQAGDYYVIATAEDEAGNVGVATGSFRAIVSDVVRPTISLTLDKTFIFPGELITSQISATSPAGIKSLSLVMDGQFPISVDATGKSMFSSGIVGTHTLVATATDNNNISGYASAVFTVMAPDTTLPVAAVTTPITGSIVKGTILFEADAVDSGGAGIKDVKFFLDNNLIATDTSSPYRIALDTTTLTQGAHTLYVTVTDNNNNTGASTKVNIFVDNIAPTVSFTTAYDTKPFSGSVEIGAVAVDDTDGSGVSFVQFLIDSKAVGQDSEAPYRYTFDSKTLTDGIHKLGIIAYDKATNISELKETTILIDNTPPTVTISIDPPTVDLGDLLPDTITIKVTASDPSGIILPSNIYVNTEPVTLDSTGVATFTPIYAGGHEIVATVKDMAANSATATYRFVVTAPADYTFPTAQITSPTDTTRITDRIQIIGTATDENFAEYELQYSLAGETNFITFYKSRTKVVNGILGTFDPSLVSNDFYTIRLVVRDVQRNTTTAQVNIQVIGDMKIGNFRITVQDVSIAVAGIPIIITRTFDSLWKAQKGDLGYGWKLDVATPDLREDENHNVFITLPDGRRTVFAFIPSFPFLFHPQYCFPGYTAMPGVYDRLEQTQYTGEILFIGGIYYGFNMQEYNPNYYRLTTVDGTVYNIYQDQYKKSYLSDVTNRNGNKLSFTKDGVTSSFGKSLKFARDSRGYITAITHNGETLVKYTIDAAGDLTATSILENIVDGIPKYNTTEYIYINHNVSKITDPRGITPIINEYDPATGRLIAHTDAFGKRITYEHRLDAREEVVYDRMNNPTIYGYNTDGLVTSITDALGGRISRGYDANKNLIAETNALRNTTRWTWDNKGLPTSITDPLGNKQEMTFNEFGQVLTRKDARGNIWGEDYDSKGNNIRSVDPLKNEILREFSDTGLLKAIIDPLGVRNEYVHNQFGWVTAEKVFDPNGKMLRLTIYKLDDMGNQLSRTIWARNTSGIWQELATWENVFDKQGRVIKAIDPYRFATETIYNSIGKPAKTIDKNGNPIEYEYDSMGQTTKIKYADLTYEEMGYDDNGNRIWFRDRSGRITRTRYDSLNRPVMTIYPDNTYTETKYNAIGQVIATIDERLNQWQHEYDAAGRKIADIDPYLHRTEYKLDSNGNQIEVKDANLNITKTEYDALNRPVKTTYPDNTFKTMQYDKAGRKIADTDQAGLTTKYVHDFLGQLIEVHDAEGGITKYVWDDVGNKIADIDAGGGAVGGAESATEGRTNKYEHDKMGRLKKKTLPGGQSEQWGYDANGNVTWHKDYNGQDINYTYDTNNRMKTKTYADGSEIRYTYTGTGKVETITDARGITRRYYDERDRLRQEDDPTTGTIKYSRDSAGNITYTETNFIAVYTTYDKLNRPVEVRDGNGITYIGYDAVGNRISETKPNGVVTTYTHNSLNRLTDITTKDRLGKVLASYTYELGPAGNRLSVTELGGSSVSYQYDRVYRLLRETRTGTNPYDIGYTYDKVGNRLTKTHNGVITNYSYNANDWLTSETTGTQTTSYTYDNNGNTTRKQSPTETVDYTYNQENRLTQVSSTQTGRINYWYADDGIRVTSQVNGVNTFYVVDRNNLTGFAQVIGEMDQAGAVTVAYTYGDDLISQTRTTGVRFYHYDGQMSTRLLTDATGAVTDTYSYYAFGELLAKTGDAINNYLYTGEQYDPNVGFYYLRVRYYIPTLGRFLTPDPVPGSIFEPATLHKYVYVTNDPVNQLDPSGLFTLGQVLGAATIMAIMTGLISGIVGAVFGGSFSLAFIRGFVTGFVGTTLVAFGVPSVIGLAVASTVAQLLEEAIYGFRDSPKLIFFRISAAFIGGLVGGAFLWKLDPLRANLDDLVTIFKAAGIAEAIEILANEFVKVAGRGISVGIISFLPRFFASVAETAWKALAGKVEERRRQFEEILKEKP